MAANLLIQNLAAAYPQLLVSEMVAAFSEAKQRYYEGGLRLSEVEAGRFCEVAYRCLEWDAWQQHTPLGQQLDSENVSRRLAAERAGRVPDSVRLHIPRALRLVYDIRNKRDAAHLADGIDPNQQDATLVISVISWVLAEFVRLHHMSSADVAHRIVTDLVTRRAPAVQDFNGFLKVLRPNLKASEYALLLLYQCGARGATLQDLTSWVPSSMRKNLSRTLRRLSDDMALIHEAPDRFLITETGIRYAEEHRLAVP